MEKWQLVYTATNQPVKAGDIVESRMQKYRVVESIGRPPHHEGSTGRIWVSDLETVDGIGSIEFFPSVFDAKWIRVPAKWCVTVNRATGEYIAVYEGESGYYQTRIYDADHAREVNKQLGITEEERLALEAGSMFGWDAPGAKADNHSNIKFAQQNRESGDALGI